LDTPMTYLPTGIAYHGVGLILTKFCTVLLQMLMKGLTVMGHLPVNTEHFLLSMVKGLPKWMTSLPLISWYMNKRQPLKNGHAYEVSSSSNETMWINQERFRFWDE
jgi:hypothetical protein